MLLFRFIQRDFAVSFSIANKRSCANSKFNLQQLGKIVGSQMGTSIVQNNINSAEHSEDDLGKMKIIGKKGWIQCFAKPIDNLKTNHKVSTLLTL